jgi:CheY-like chemotaxis protein
MTQGKASPVVLLVEADADLRELEQLILSDGGFPVTPIPPTEDPVRYAARTAPRVIVIHVGRSQPFGPDILDAFQADPTTQRIPIVAITLAETTAAQAQAGPNVAQVVVPPYDVVAFRRSVATAVGHPPPAGTLAEARGRVSATVAFAAGELVRHARAIVLRTVEGLRQGEPYSSRFAELSTGLVDGLGAILGAIAVGLQRGLAPNEVFAVPEVQQSIGEHVRLRQSQALGLAAVLREDQALTDQVDQFLQGLVGHEGFGADDALDVARRVQALTCELRRVLVEKYRSEPGPEHPS